MEAATAVRERARRLDAGDAGVWLAAVLLIAYLGLNSGGYTETERGEAGVIVWWAVLLGAAVGVLPLAWGTRAGRWMLALLFALAAWTALSVIWTESAERTIVEAARAATYLGVFALALAVAGTGRWRALLHGVAAGIALIVAIALLSRLQPSWFPEQTTERFLPGRELGSRLAYPLNYSSGLAAFAAMSLPLLLGVSALARTVPVRALAAAAIPVAALVLWYTGSSLSVPLAAIGLIAFMALAPDRLPKLATLLVAGAGSAVLILVAAHHDALDRGLSTAAAQREGDDVTIVVLLVVAAVAAAQAGLALLGRRVERPGWLEVPPRVALGAAVAAVLGALVVALALGAPSELSDRWDEFRSRDAADPRTAARGAEILDISSSGRYQFWQSALDANETDPLIGIGAGTFEFWWAREGSLAIFVRDAHSLYIEALAELGIVGFALVLAFVAGVLIVGAGRLLRAPPELRLGLAVAVAGCAVFAAAATVDWMWELGVLPVSFMLLAGVAIAGRDSELARRPTPAGGWFRSRWLPRIGVGALALAALVLIAIPLASGVAIEQSRADARSGDLEGALSQARRAEDLQPYAATPLLQEAVLLERAGDLDAAARAARKATERESTNWRTWLTLSRLEALRGNPRLALNAYRHAAGLNPRFLM